MRLWWIIERPVSPKKTGIATRPPRPAMARVPPRFRGTATPRPAASGNIGPVPEAPIFSPAGAPGGGRIAVSSGFGAGSAHAISASGSIGRRPSRRRRFKAGLWPTWKIHPRGLSRCHRQTESLHVSTQGGAERHKQFRSFHFSRRRPPLGCLPCYQSLRHQPRHVRQERLFLPL